MKFIFVTGGVCSSIGKGIIASSVGLLLKSQNLKVLIKKFDPYLNVDPGTMNPFEHGEVFVTVDGAETDLDLGHYERFIDTELTKYSNVTTGLVYNRIIEKERYGEYSGRTVQVVPHVTNEIKQSMWYNPYDHDIDVMIIEIGGTVGDIELSPFIEAARQIMREVKSSDFMVIHVALLPYLYNTSETKTKPIQHSVRVLNSLGLQPEFIVCRSHVNLTVNNIKKIALFCNLPESHIIEGRDLESIYQVPIELKKQNLHLLINQKLELSPSAINLTEWEQFLSSYKAVNKEVKIAVVGKYSAGNKDAYLSINEALQHAALKKQAKVKIDYLSSAIFDNYISTSLLDNYDGIIVPGGFGKRGMNGKINAIKYCRLNKKPYLGICLGMQLACIEYARNVFNIDDANSVEIDPLTKNPVIGYLKDIERDKIGGSLRLGKYKCALKSNTLTRKLYNDDFTFERHRHRFEVTEHFVKNIVKDDTNFTFSGHDASQPAIKELIELKNHPYFVACQFHPEFLSRPIKPHPLFLGLISAAISNKS